MAAGGQPDLSAFQLEMATLFFALPASEGFLLAGGAALLAQHLTSRPTEDLDFFTAPRRGQVPAARDALEAAVCERGWTAERIHDSDTFFADVYVLDRHFGKDVMLAWAAQIDKGFDIKVLADMIATLDRLADDELPVPDGMSAAELRAFYAAWRSELAA